jgi:hexosaminidase
LKFTLICECVVKGLQISLWGEMIRTMDQAEYMLYPRLLSAAERAWHVADWEMIADDRNDFSRRQQADWRQFAIAVGQRELRRLDRLGVQYRLPPPGVKYVGSLCIYLSELYTVLNMRW